MKVAVVGAGWYGCHISLVLLERGHEVVLFEQSGGVFTGASGHNQNRLHLGFHYPRSGRTCQQILSTHQRFMGRYSHLVTSIHENIYAIADDSLIDYLAYQNVYRGKVPYQEVDPKCFGLNHIEGAIRCQECLLLTDNCSEFFYSHLNHVLRLDTPVLTIDNKSSGVFINGERFDYCFVCTYNQAWPGKTPTVYEVALMLVYEKIGLCPVGALTVMDGPYFSLFPYRDNLYTLSSVRNTPYLASEDIGIVKAATKIEPLQLAVCREKFEGEINRYTDWFSTSFRYLSYLVSVKTKPVADGSANREFHYETDERVCRLYSGKINNVIKAEDVATQVLATYPP